MRWVRWVDMMRLLWFYMVMHDEMYAMRGCDDLFVDDVCDDAWWG
jgi:hypothetical protein